MLIKRIITTLTLMIAVATPVQAAKYIALVQPTEEQQVRMDQGQQSIQSLRGTTLISIVSPDGSFSKRSSFQILAANGGEAPFNFGTENITATMADGTPIRILSYAELAAKEKKRQMWAAIAASVSAAGNSMQAASAGYSHSYGTYSAQSYGSFGHANTFGTASVSTYNAGQAYAAQAIAEKKNEELFEQVAHNHAARMASLKAVLNTTTINPGSSYGGTVQFELPKEVRVAAKKDTVEILLKVSAGAEEHLFRLLLAKAK